MAATAVVRALFLTTLVTFCLLLHGCGGGSKQSEETTPVEAQKGEDKLQDEEANVVEIEKENKLEGVSAVQMNEGTTKRDPGFLQQHGHSAHKRHHKRTLGGLVEESSQNQHHHGHHHPRHHAEPKAVRMDSLEVQHRAQVIAGNKTRRHGRHHFKHHEDQA